MFIPLMPQWATPSRCHSYFDLDDTPIDEMPARRQPAPGHPWNFWTVPEVCEAYDWPTDLAGGGVIGILAMGGGYVRRDLETYFGGLGQPMPHIVNVSLGGHYNSPGRYRGSGPDHDVEVALDIQVAAASYYVATGRAASIRIYWTGTDLRWMAPAIYCAAADGCSTFTISWGAPELTWEMLNWPFGPSASVQLEAALITAAMQGMTVFAAAGDQEANSGGTRPMVHLPAGCPHAVGCGGTRKTRDYERVWNNDPGFPNGFGTGGGYSNLFWPQPWSWRAPRGPGRIVPDVSGNADKQTGYHIHVHGRDRITGGTSAVAPLYAGLFAGFGRKLGFVNATLWRSPDCFTDITKGHNDGFDARPGPDACSGMGVPIGRELARLFRAKRRVKEEVYEAA